jgi:hypothetical protein
MIGSVEAISRWVDRASRTAARGRRVRPAAGIALALGVAGCVVGLAACAPAAVVTLGPLATASIGTGASATSGDSSAAPGDESATPADSSADLVSPVVGVLTHIDATGLSQVTGFTLRTGDGRSVDFRLGILENGSDFPPGHLAEHLASSAPVRVSFRRNGADLVVYRLEDGS